MAEVPAIHGTGLLALPHTPYGTAAWIPRNTFCSRIDGVESQYLLDQKGNRPNARPSKGVGMNKVHTRGIGSRLALARVVCLPDGVRLEIHRSTMHVFSHIAGEGSRDVSRSAVCAEAAATILARTIPFSESSHTVL